MGTAVRENTEYRQPGSRSRGRLEGVPDPDTATPPVALSAAPRVLLLNASYEALTALPARRAVVMLIGGKADVVHEHPREVLVRSVDTAVRVPSVIRLREYVRIPYHSQIPMTRSALMHRDSHRCGYCNAKATTIDHVIPRSRGGAHGWENCVASCAPCNHRKADKLLSELGWELRVPLVAPRGRTWRLVSQLREIGPHWDDYLYLDAA
ncbi:HNH endonuclease [Dietzia sp. NCCP-2495]|uniref:HNH endonuclease n=1 Tax=Dietzia sp. NCCP-2495 TaxID=2934675 RepID=UPI0016B33BA9|nr:HNH endonuclease [Dietzia sp. NCCP-2495]NLD84579.1 HNH endonuclease [Actinomycetales bacterium]GLB62726.1 HNH endonuclease [Dietzia sp. NCCP-2495]